MAGAKPYGQLHFREVRGWRMAYVDEGDGDAIVFAHGNPTSSYLWRNVMPHLEGLGRLVAADMIGMGGSDKLHPSGPDRYHYAEQRDYLFALWDALDLGDNVTLVLHDWGSVLGFDWANQHRDRVQGIAFMEASVTPISWSDFPPDLRGVFEGFRSPQGETMVLEQNIFVEQVLPAGMQRQLTDEEMDHYRQPFVNPGESRLADVVLATQHPHRRRTRRRRIGGQRLQQLVGRKRCAQAVRQRRTRRHRPRPLARPHPLVAEPHRDHRHWSAFRPGGQPRRNRHCRRAIRAQAALALEAGSQRYSMALNCPDWAMVEGPLNELNSPAETPSCSSFALLNRAVSPGRRRRFAAAPFTNVWTGWRATLMWAHDT